MQNLIVIGGGELARVIIETAQAQKCWNVIGFVDPDPCIETTRRLGVERLGTDDDLPAYPHARIILGVGTIKVSDIRRNIVARVAMPASRWATIIHPAAYVSPSAILSPGAIVLAGAVICSGASIGSHCIINLGAKIDHDVHVGSFVHVAPQAALGGGSRIEDDSYIGMGAIVRDHLTVSQRTLVGMGAVVSKTFAPGKTLVGLPAREIK
ncbi:MAG: acetyltransferase [Bradyrhizobium sp.]|uniref:acetyltransferase n=1 Tax=Bradyrhizobium sp. TaxID=376 RepID=UPI0029B4DD56|nr:acetyltransferase [Bradyrhizobium sp.]MDX3971180.1 acetyltransferase [Bradyrhizobium sp.]